MHELTLFTNPTFGEIRTLETDGGMTCGDVTAAGGTVAEYGTFSLDFGWGT